MSMAGGRPGAVRGDLVRIFDGDSVAGLGDGELLGRFADRGDEGAFEALVGRLGPMVLGVCRRMLADPHDVDDAFQATFLVLVKKARSIRDRELVGPWLHGVATRTARRARANSARRAARERVAVVPEAREDEAGLESQWPELRALIDEEIGRLPEHHRRPVVLCDVEGLTREEAAQRLGWTLNMVRGRLERARDRLRGRLARRGLTPSGAWMALMVVPPTPPPALVAATSRAALGFSAGRMGTGLASASAVALSRGVLRMMMLSKLKVGLAVAVSAGFVAAGSGMIAAQGPGNAVFTPPAKVVDRADDARPAGGDIAALGLSRIEMARKRLKTQVTFYTEGRITIDRIIDASQTLMDAEMDAATTPGERKAAIRTHLDRIKEFEVREKAELAIGRATDADVEEIQTRRLDIEYRLAKEEAGTVPPRVPPAAPATNATPADPTVVDRLTRERVEIARRIFAEAKRLFPAEIDVVDFLKASSTLLEAERDAAGTKAGREAAIRTMVDNLRRTVAAKEDLLRRGIARPNEVDMARLGLLNAEIELTRESAGSGPTSVADLARRVAEVERKLDRILNLLDAPRR